MPRKFDLRNNVLQNIFVLVSILLLGSLSVDARSQIHSYNQFPQGKTMLAAFDEIDNATTLSSASAGRILNITLQAEPNQANEYIQMYKGHNELWKSAELRLPRGGNGSRFVLVLQPTAPIPMSDIMNHYGDVLALISPNPSAGDQGMFGFSYKRKVGTIMFSFHNFEDQSARIILFDRM